MAQGRRHGRTADLPATRAHAPPALFGLAPRVLLRTHEDRRLKGSSSSESLFFGGAGSQGVMDARPPPRDHRREPPKKRRPPDRCRWFPIFFFRQPSAEEAFTESQTINASFEKEKELGNRNTHTYIHTDTHGTHTDRHDRGDKRVPARTHTELVNAVGRA